MPTISALDEAMRRPGRSVPGVNRLGGGTVTMAAANQPWRVVGTDAVVYQLYQPSGRVLALRCPLSDTPPRALADHYRALASDLTIKKVRDAPGSPLVGDIAYLPDGLLLPAPDLRSHPHPVVALEWVMGSTLLAAADQACRDSDSDELTAMAEAWLLAVDLLASASVAHGDLTATNALVRPDGSIALVDYDTFVWPGAPRIEGATGTPGYTHPMGMPARPPERRDAFPALVVYVSLRVLARHPSLRGEYGDRVDSPDGTLLFYDRDLADPDGSVLFAGLLAEDDPEIGPLLRALRQACVSPAAATPSLREIVPAERRQPPVRLGRKRSNTPESRTTPAAPAPRASSPPPAPSPSPAPSPPSQGQPASTPRRAAVQPNVTSAGPPAPLRAQAAAPAPEVRERQRNLTRLNSFLLAGDEEGALRYWYDSGLADDVDAVTEIGPRIAQIERARALRRARAAAANDRVRHQRDGLERLRTALDAGDTSTVASLWPEVRQEPLAAAFGIRVLDVLRGVFEATIAAALEQKDDAAMVRAVSDAAAAGITIRPSERRVARAASARLRVRRELAAALATDDRPTLASLALSGRLTDLGSLEPPARRAALRALAWPHLARALETEDDAKILDAFDRELFGEAGDLTPAQWRRVEEAGARQSWLQRVRTQLRARDTSALRRSLTEAPPGALERLRPVERRRIERLTQQSVALERLTMAVQEGSDEAIVAALSGVEAAGATLPDTLDWPLVRSVVDRVTLVAAIRRAAADPPDYARLARLLPTARAAAKDGNDFSLGLDIAQLESDVLRAAQLARIREAIAGDDDVGIVAAASPDPHGALAMLTPDDRVRVDRAFTGHRRGELLDGGNQASGRPRSRGE